VTIIQEQTALHLAIERALGRFVSRTEMEVIQNADDSLCDALLVDKLCEQGYQWRMTPYSVSFRQKNQFMHGTDFIKTLAFGSFADPKTQNQ
jgi:hypothetical protein